MPEIIEPKEKVRLGWFYWLGWLIMAAHVFFIAFNTTMMIVDGLSLLRVFFVLFFGFQIFDVRNTQLRDLEAERKWARYARNY